MKAQYEIPEHNLSALQAGIKKLNKRARKLNLPAITLEVIGERQEKVAGNTVGFQFDFTRTWYIVELSGTEPRFEGYSLVGVLAQAVMDNDTVEGIIHAVPGATIPRALATRFAECDHCQKLRRRNDVYIVQQVATGEFKVVGSNCLADFLGSTDPHALAQSCEMLGEAAQLCGGAEGDDFYGAGDGRAAKPELLFILTLAALVIRVDGWKSRAQAETDGRTRATADTVGELMSYVTGARKPQTHDEKVWLARYVYDGIYSTGIITQPAQWDDPEVAEAAREWARGLADSDSEYLYKLSQAARMVAVDDRSFGLVVSMVGSYVRETVRKAERAAQYAAESQYVGTIGARIEGELELVATFESSNAYGLVTICYYRDANGNRLTWSASGQPAEDVATKGVAFNAAYTVKQHSLSRDGQRVTKIQRVTVAKVKPVKKAKKELAYA